MSRPNSPPPNPVQEGLPPQAPQQPQAPPPQPPQQQAPPAQPPAPRANLNVADVNVIAAIVAQVLQQQPQVAPQPKVNINPPDTFNGSHDKFQAWWEDVCRYLDAKHYTNLDDRIYVTASYMKGGLTEGWKRRLFANLHAVTDWDDFCRRVKTTFEDPHRAQKAREAMEHLDQGNKSIDDFMASFHSLASDADLTDDAELIRLTRKSVKPKIIESMFNSGNVPDTIDAFAGRVLQLERLQEQYALQKKLDHPTSASHTFKPAPPAYRPAPAPMASSSSQPRQVPTGTVFGGTGQPMEVGKVKAKHNCFECGSPDHWRRDCPKREKMDI